MALPQRIGDADDGLDAIDPLVDSPGREGLTGTAPATLYKPLPERDQITLPPDGRPPSEQPPWRQDFPIDWPQDQYVARRDFSKFMVLTSFAFVVGQVWIGVQNWFRRRRGTPPIAKVADLAAVPPPGPPPLRSAASRAACGTSSARRSRPAPRRTRSSSKP